MASATAQQPPPPQSVQTQHGQLTQQAAIGALSVALFSGVPAEQLQAIAEALLMPFGFSALAVHQVLAVTVGHAVDLQVNAAPGSAAEQMAQLAAPNHALYLFNAAKRLSADPTAIAAERRYFAQHLAAARGRREAATKTDAAALRFGQTLGWHTQKDGLVDPDCRHLEGTNFTVADPPRVHGRPVIPGTVHPSCRCFAGAPHPVRVREPARALAGVGLSNAPIELAFDPDEPRDWRGRWIRKVSSFFNAPHPSSGVALKKATDAIDEVHRLPGGLPEVPVLPEPGGAHLGGGLAGLYRHPEDHPALILLDTEYEDYGVSLGAHALTHEIGHYVDLVAFRDEYEPGPQDDDHRFYSSAASGPGADIVNVAAESQEIQALQSAHDRIEADLAEADGQLRDELELVLAQLKYLLSPWEIFARAYAQWIAYRSADIGLLREIELQRRNLGPAHWSVASFAPIGEAFDTLFGDRRWLTPRER